MEQTAERIRHRFGVNIETQMGLAETLSLPIAQAAERLVSCLLRDGKILLCGLGGSAANCLHFTTAMLSRYDVERPPLPVISLTTDPSVLTGITFNGQTDQAFARQIQALGQQNDLLLILTTTGNANAILQAINAAQDRGMDVIALNGRDSGLMGTHLGPEDLEINVPAEHPAFVREMHLFMLHCFCDLIEHALFGQMTG